MAIRTLIDRLPRPAIPLTWEGFLYRMRTVFLWPLLVGAAAVILFAFVPQSREVYVAMWDEGRWLQAVVGFLLVALFCLQIDCWHRQLGLAFIDRAYPRHADINLDRALVQWNANVCRVAALLPLFGLFVGVFLAIRADALDRFELAKLTATTRTDPSIVLQAERPPEIDWQIAGIVLASLVLSVGFGWVCLMLYRWIRSTRLEPRVFDRQMRGLLVCTVTLLTAVVAVVPVIWGFENYAVGVARAIGPLGLSAIGLIGLVTALMLLSYVSDMARLPMLGLAVLLLIGWLGVQLFRSLQVESRPATAEIMAEAAGTAAPVAQVAMSKTPTPAMVAKRARLVYDRTPVTGAFDSWLAKRLDRAEYGDKPYPVFIVTAQGGGIYAAATTLSFLTSLQQECSAFSQHVFAISGVSGGAVGAAVYGGLVADLEQVTTKGCRPDQRSTEPLTAKARRIIATDHLSPALFQIWPDFVRTLGFGNKFDRSAALEHSLACSFDILQANGLSCPRAAGASGVRVRYVDHWKPGEAGPAMILNATWSETGYRVAFAPFPLHATSDGTLFSFPSLGPINGIDIKDFSAFGIDMPVDLSLIEAAFVSARFPGIVPAFTADAGPVGGAQRETGGKVWNFVDGGYVDNSGASTALELYQTLSAHVTSADYRQKRLPPVDLYLVMLTDVTSDPDLVSVPGGAILNDTIAPIKALLSVRGQLSNRAVRRALDSLAPTATPDDLVGRPRAGNANGGVPPVLVVNLKQTTFEPLLAWKMSRQRQDTIDVILGINGDPVCREVAAETSVERSAAIPVTRVIDDNRCLKRAIRDVIAGTRPQRRADPLAGSGNATTGTP